MKLNYTFLINCQLSGNRIKTVNYKFLVNSSLIKCELSEIRKQCKSKYNVIYAFLTNGNSNKQHLRKFLCVPLKTMCEEKLRKRKAMRVKEKVCEKSRDIVTSWIVWVLHVNVLLSFEKKETPNWQFTSVIRDAFFIYLSFHRYALRRHHNEYFLNYHLKKAKLDLELFFPRESQLNLVLVPWKD